MAGIVIALGGCSWHKHAENTIRFNLLRGGSMKPNRSASSSRQRARTLLLAIVVGTAFLSSSVASAKPPFLAFNYAASPVLTNPGQDSQACMDTGVPLCPSGHSCEVFAYSGTGMGTPGFGNTNIEVCILEDRNLGLPNATGGVRRYVRGQWSLNRQRRAEYEFDPRSVGGDFVDLVVSYRRRHCVPEYLWHHPVGTVGPRRG
jgi:hypothetical protein